MRNLAFTAIFYFSAMVPLDTVGVWTVEDKNEKEPGWHLVQQL